MRLIAGNALRRVNMDILTGVNAEDYSEVAKKEHLEPIEVELRKLEDQVFEVHKEFLYMREREAAMRDTNGELAAKHAAGVPLLTLLLGSQSQPTPASCGTPSSASSGCCRSPGGRCTTSAASSARTRLPRTKHAPAFT